jgi:hypothetical protein
MQYGTLHKKMWRGTPVDVSLHLSVKVLNFEYKTISYVRKYRVMLEGLIILVPCIPDPIFMIDQKIMGVECMQFYFYTDPKIMTNRESFHCMRANFG